ncbi:uncharacterized protein LOC134701287 [Mytilus trossulus]|uniref:uncharacterized protein LOC134701287 n=1 Tax=Mytilus trossulus TaxID=6551 RepID=UPI00300454C7
MATKEIATFCDICLIRDLNKLAEEFCPQCEEVFCGDCRNHHKISKSSKSHQTISIDKYNKLPSFIKNISHNCEEHDCFLEVYCKSHDSLCCTRCLISSHKECKEIIFIEDFLAPSSRHQSAAVANVEKVLKYLDDNICLAIKDRNRNLTELREQKRVIVEQIKEKRQEINTVLDNLEGALLDEVSAIDNEYCLKIDEVIVKLEDEKKKIDEIKNDFETVKVFASNLQIFMGTKALQENVSTNEMKLQVLYDNGNLNNITMEYKFNVKLEKFIKDEIKAFGDLKVDNYDKHTSFSWKGDKSAQLYKTISGAKTIENINVRLVRKINIDVYGLTGCAILEDGNMLFLEAHNNNLMKYAPNGEFCSKSNFNLMSDDIGYDLAVIDTNRVAISGGGNPPYRIYVIEITCSNKEFRKIIEVDGYSYGLNYHNGLLICCISDKGIEIFDRLQKKFTNVRKMHNAPLTLMNTYVTSNNHFIFHSNCHEHSVVCYDFNGQLQWTYSDSLLRKPCGITLDSISNIYVAGFDSNNIVVISPDGKQAKELIGSSDGLSNPRAIHFDKTKNLLLVANYNKAAFLFRV